MSWLEKLGNFLSDFNPPTYGAGFRKSGVGISNHRNLITLDGESVYFFQLGNSEAEKYLEDITFLNGKIGWLAYLVQEVFYREEVAEELYNALFDALYGGALEAPKYLSKEIIFQWLDEISPQVEILVKLLLLKR
ncbi:MAG: hypothetical protein HGA27_03260 [Peptococcaceae bacterium]|nr:hypothetical protein [Peptococcaceae bacterium]